MPQLSRTGIVIATTNSHFWLGRFCVHWMRLRPGTRLATAVHRAVAAYPYTCDLEPEVAAAIAVAGPAAASAWTPSCGPRGSRASSRA